MGARNSSVLSIFLQLFGDKVAETIAGPDPQRKTDFFRYLSLRMLMHGLPEPAKSVRNMERAAYFNVMKSLDGAVPSDKLWGCHKYFTMRDGFPVLEQHVRGNIADNGRP